MGKLMHNGRPKKPTHEHDTPSWFLEWRFNEGALWQCECGKYFRLHRTYSNSRLWWVGTVLQAGDMEYIDDDVQ